jgi:hypothetical protein
MLPGVKHESENNNHGGSNQFERNSVNNEIEHLCKYNMNRLVDVFVLEMYLLGAGAAPGAGVPTLRKGLRYFYCIALHHFGAILKVSPPVFSENLDSRPLPQGSWAFFLALSALSVENAHSRAK